MKQDKTIKDAALEIIYKNKAVRTFITKHSPLWFFNMYFADHTEFATAPFQCEMLDLIERDDWQLLCFVSFRGSSKTTILCTANVLWSIFGTRQSKFALIISATQAQAKQQMMNIRGALEHNEILKQDFGPFREETDQWGGSTIVFSKLDARISVVSVNESIRGIKHLQHRPDTVIIDDPEDTQSAKTKEGRDKIYNWFKGEVMPIGSTRTRIVVLGNIVHERCLVMRLKEEITNGTTTGVYKQYPLITESGESAWPGKFPTLADIATERKRIGNDRTWYREYLLKILPEDDRVIDPESIKYYDVLPPKTPEFGYRCSVSAVDPAAKTAEASDYTAIVSAQIYGYGKDVKIYVLPNPINRKMLFPEIIQTIKDVCVRIGEGARTRTYIEGNAAQSYAIQQLAHEGYPVTEVISRGEKRERLFCITPSIQNAQVVFPRKGCEALISQLVNFDLEDHDDLCDALVILVTQALKDDGGYTPFSRITTPPPARDEDDPEMYPHSTRLPFHGISKMIF